MSTQLLHHQSARGHTFGQKADDLPHFVLETDFENSVCLVNDESAEVIENESFRVLDGHKTEMSVPTGVNAHQT